MDSVSVAQIMRSFFMQWPTNINFPIKHSLKNKKSFFKKWKDRRRPFLPFLLSMFLIFSCCTKEAEGWMVSQDHALVRGLRESLWLGWMNLKRCCKGVYSKECSSGVWVLDALYGSEKQQQCRVLQKREGCFKAGSACRVAGSNWFESGQQPWRGPCRTWVMVTD